MTAADVGTCACGAPMRQVIVAAICGPGLPGPVYALECSSDEHREQMAAQDRADRKAADERAMADALERGLIVPDDTPEAERWVDQ